MNQRRNINSGGVLMSNPKFNGAQFSNPESIEQVKRKKMRREMIFGQKQAHSNQSGGFFAKMQGEDILNQFRNLKITNNITKDENMKLKTKIQQIQQELNQRDKELEKLTIKLQQTLSAPNIGPDNVKDVHHFTESFIVSQLKKNNRDLKQEVIEKDRLIEQLKRNIKLTKTQEIEIELTVYIDECLRLRG
jgi:seryl-tRNA synthetase